ncbi:hypothetical protein phiCbK_319 [Caulobacter phage phiCbK]|uniref:Uncharacterized protein n=2 Tax=Viruses TaxID=10239 RepID=J3SVW9_9CAUD|nr:hypothetical protein phiCbK_319 [Caulobacter phage phiCbK]
MEACLQNTHDWVVALFAGIIAGAALIKLVERLFGKY